MANTAYKKGTQYMLENGLSGKTVKAVLVDTALYTFNQNTHQFLSDIPAGARIATTDALANMTFTDGTWDADNLALPDVGGGGTAEALVLYVDTGSAATSALLLYIDTATGLPITEDGTADTITWNASGIYAVS